MRLRHFFPLLFFTGYMFVVACGSVSIDIYGQIPSNLYNSLEKESSRISIICGIDTTNAYGFVEYLDSFSDILFSGVTANEGDYTFFIGQTGCEETKRALNEISGEGYLIKAEGNNYIIAGTDETWTALALFVFEKRLSVFDSTLIIPSTFEMKKEYTEPQLISILINEGLSFSISSKPVIICHGDGECKYGQGATSDGDYIYILNRNPKDNQSIIYRYSIDSAEKSGQSYVFDAGHSNDLTINPLKNTLIVAHGMSQGKRLTFINTKSLAVERTIEISVGAGAIAFNPNKRLFAISQGGTSLIITDESFNVLSSYTREYMPGYTAQGMGCDDSYIYFPMSSNKDNIIVVYDWGGTYITSLQLNTAMESESLFYAKGNYYINFNHSGSELHIINPILYYSNTNRINRDNLL